LRVAPYCLDTSGEKSYTLAFACYLLATRVLAGLSSDLVLLGLIATSRTDDSGALSHPGSRFKETLVVGPGGFGFESDTLRTMARRSESRRHIARSKCHSRKDGSMATKVLVTGGAGYVGSVLVPALLEEGYAVHVLDQFVFGQTSLAECCINPNFQVTRGDCRDRETVSRLMRDADYIIPLAAVVGAPACKNDPTAAISINRDAIKLILSLRSSRQRIILPNTNSGYGIGEKQAPCSEESPLRSISLYGKTKVEAELAVLDAGNAITFRLATVFGMSSRMRLDLLVNDFVYRAVHDRAVVVFEGHAKRNYIHIRDVARAFLHAMEQFETMKDQAYNVGLSDANLSKLELCVQIRKQVPNFVFLEAPIGEDPDKRDYIVSNAKIEGTDFRPSFSLGFGIQELIKGYTILRNGRFGNV
jgi:nucleoside-diphosphate-sugar epimerase